MKFLGLFMIVFFISVQTMDLDTVRQSYKEAAQDHSKIETFYNMVSKVTKSDIIELVAYKGAAIALKARGAATIKEKKEGFVNAVSLVEFAVEKDPSNIEIRFIRISIQENTPKLLKYKDAIEADKHFILNQFKTIKAGLLKNLIKDYISQSKVFTNEEKSVILAY
ncbi:hypothetical protein ACFSKN_11195 [Mariniflexile gromovii]|uniref:Uncharacterized protein n=1 Tax=Mariniflexile gromovii TaxID=362523 RepID=A0ABS4BXE5_9FLAO|nr:hypothetical protein [Mariniflexile gromovii]MBP0905264.1 hypothetical protein [Mariniflexile gromovii]